MKGAVESLAYNCIDALWHQVHSQSGIKFFVCGLKSYNISNDDVNYVISYH